MSSYKKRGKNSFLLTVELGYDTRGSRIRQFKTIKVKDEKLLKTTKKLNAFLDFELMKFKSEVETGLYISPEKMTFEAFVSEWKTKFVETNLEETTIGNYMFHIKKRILPYFGHMRIDQIKTMHIVDYIQKLSEPGSRIDGNGTLGSSSIVYNFRVLQSVFSKAKEWKVILENPMAGVRKPKEITKEMDFYSEDEVKNLFESLTREEPQVRVLITLALTTGMRRAELLGLEWKNIDLGNGILEVKQSIPKFINGIPLLKLPKTKSSVRKISLSPSVVNELNEYHTYMKEQKLIMGSKWKGEDSHSFLFVNQFGKLYYPKTLTEKWHSFHSRNPQLKFIRLHDLRHTSATLLISQGVHAKVIAKRLGHSKIATTMDRYGHVIESADRAAANTFDELIPIQKEKTYPL